jgi:hypothetical protein
VERMKYLPWDRRVSHAERSSLMFCKLCSNTIPSIGNISKTLSGPRSKNPRELVKPMECYVLLRGVKLRHHSCNLKLWPLWD